MSNHRTFMYLFLGLALGKLAACQSSPDTRFQEVAPTRSGIDFANHLEESEDLNIIQYLYFYNGGGIAAGDVNNDGWTDLFYTANQGANRLYLNQGKTDVFTFEDITETAGVGGESGPATWTTGATMVDINADGWLDIYVCEMAGYLSFQGRNRLYINQGVKGDQPFPTFVESAADYGLDVASYSQQAAFFDYDRDGDLDMFLLNQAVHTPDSYKPARMRSRFDTQAGDRLFRNDGGRFVDVSDTAGIYQGSMGYGLDVSIADLNNDGWPDIYVSNDFHENDYLYYNQGDGTFREDVMGSMGHVSTFSMGNAIADYNNDGWADVLSLDMKPEDEIIYKSSTGADSYDIYRYKLSFGYHYQYPRNMLQQNQGALFGEGAVQFSEVGQLLGVATTDWSWSVLLSDLDNDGLKDIFVTNGIPARPNNLDYIKFTSDTLARQSSDLEFIKKMPEGRVPNYAFRNDGVSFQPVAERWGLDRNGFSNGAIDVDLDNDGDLDLAVNNLNSSATLYRNNTRELDTANFLAVNFRGSARNAQGVGARVVLHSPEMTQVQENQLNRGWLSSRNTGNLLFGLGTQHRVDSLIVTWPDGRRQQLKNVPVNRSITLSYADATVPDTLSPDSPQKMFTEVTEQSGVNFRHRENNPLDFSREKLLPHLLSTEGPKLAVADIDGDGLEDFFIGGAKGQPGELYRQQAGESAYFRQGDSSTFVQHQSCEDVGAAFFDADQDGDPDLYVVSGGSESEDTHALPDRLYLNDGQGNFTYAEGALPEVWANGSCVVPFDMDDDGRTDLFVGGRSLPLSYGMPGRSMILRNSGQGTFTDVTGDLLDNDGGIGMVTDALWVPERQELIVVGEWMPVTIYNFREDSVRRTRLETTAGWWNTVEGGDIDDDGDQDVLLGNLGLNTNLTASVDAPLKLYVEDYDENLSLDPIMAYYRQGKQWVYPHLDLLSEQILLAKRAYRTYDRYANSSFSEVFPDEQVADSYQRQVQTLASGYLEYDQGQYHLKNFPNTAQYSPIQEYAVDDFDQDGQTDILAVGNFDGNHPMMGRSDASFGLMLRRSENRRAEPRWVARPPRETGFAVPGDARDVKIIRTGSSEKLVIVSRNDDTVRIFKYTPKAH